MVQCGLCSPDPPPAFGTPRKGCPRDRFLHRQCPQPSAALYFKQPQLVQPRPLSISAEPLSTSQLHPACQHLYCIWGLTNLACKHMPSRTVSCPQVILARVGRGRFVVIQVHVGVRSEIRVSTGQTAPVLDPAHLWVARQLSLLPRPSLPVGCTPEGTPSFS